MFGVGALLTEEEKARSESYKNKARRREDDEFEAQVRQDNEDSDSDDEFKSSRKKTPQKKAARRIEYDGKADYLEWQRKQGGTQPRSINVQKKQAAKERKRHNAATRDAEAFLEKTQRPVRPWGPLEPEPEIETAWKEDKPDLEGPALSSKPPPAITVAPGLSYAAQLKRAGDVGQESQASVDKQDSPSTKAVQPPHLVGSTTHGAPIAAMPMRPKESATIAKAPMSVGSNASQGRTLKAPRPLPAVPAMPSKGPPKVQAAEIASGATFLRPPITFGSFGPSKLSGSCADAMDNEVPLPTSAGPCNLDTSSASSTAHPVLSHQVSASATPEPVQPQTADPLVFDEASPRVRLPRPVLPELVQTLEQIFEPLAYVKEPRKKLSICITAHKALEKETDAPDARYPVDTIRRARGLYVRAMLVLRTQIAIEGHDNGDLPPQQVDCSTRPPDSDKLLFREEDKLRPQTMAKETPPAAKKQVAREAPVAKTDKTPVQAPKPLSFPSATSKLLQSSKSTAQSSSSTNKADRLAARYAGSAQSRSSRQPLKEPSAPSVRK